MRAGNYIEQKRDDDWGKEARWLTLNVSRGSEDL